MKSRFPFLSYKQQLFLRRLIETGWTESLKSTPYFLVTTNALRRKKMLMFDVSSSGLAYFEATQLALDWYTQNWLPKHD